MDIEEQKRQFYQLVSPSFPNEWEVDEILEILAGTGMVERRALLAHVPAIWPVSHSLCLSYLAEGVRAVSAFPLELLPEWVRQVLFRYEEGGLRQAREFMADIEKNFLAPLHGRAGVSWAETAGRMLLYMRGVSGLSLDLEVDPEGRLWTDTRTIYLPAEMRLFPERLDNLLFYKFLLTIQWGFIALGSHRLHPRAADFSRLTARYGAKATGERIEDYLSSFPDPLLAGKVLQLLEFERVANLLRRQLPGLVRQAAPLALRLVELYRGLWSAREEKILDLLQMLLTPAKAEDERQDDRSGRNRPQVEGLEKLPGLYDELAQYAGGGEEGILPVLLGHLDFAAARATIEQTRREDKEIFVTRMAAFLHENGRQEGGETGEVAGGEGEADAVLVSSQSRGRQEARERTAMLALANETAMPPELAAVKQRIEADIGEIPLGYIQAAVGMAGQGRTACGFSPSDEGRPVIDAHFTYDEWDYRRAGYRKDWCSLSEKELPQLTSAFFPLTLQKYRGLITRVRRQFEMLRTTHRFIRRRRHGDDLDFDAIVEALGDQRAGFAPSDRLFIRLLRDQRDIAALFLVDMSNSTEGWVGKLIKEALVLLCEVMEVTGDRYGIYGFSGMRRSRCELFHVKHLDELYGESIRQRIGAIGPREYTRMGPPIRHLTRLLQATDARLRLLITLTDGKPEDYDGYTDDYAIEDTRKALIEARGGGVQAFCLTVDQKAHDYLAHMYGRGNYIFVNKIESLPLRMTDFYRLLTS
jgi:nitric oxide reductase NorD protein